MHGGMGITTGMVAGPRVGLQAGLAGSGLDGAQSGDGLVRTERNECNETAGLL